MNSLIECVNVSNKSNQSPRDVNHALNGPKYATASRVIGWDYSPTPAAGFFSPRYVRRFITVLSLSEEINKSPDGVKGEPIHQNLTY